MTNKKFTIFLICLVALLACLGVNAQHKPHWHGQNSIKATPIFIDKLIKAGYFVSWPVTPPKEKGCEMYCDSIVGKVVVCNYHCK